MATRVIGGYVVLEELARGASGAVFRARHPDGGREVAIKVLLRGEQATEVELERFRREAKALAHLSHPGIVAIHGTGVEQGCPYLVMDLVEGRSLEQVIESERRFMPARAAEITLRLADAVSHAHEQGVLHRDLKPANVIVLPDGSPRLTDFGLARDVAGPSSLSRSGMLMGTPAYWPPEQARGERSEIGPWSDVYGLGAILYAMLTASPPIAGESLHEILVATESKEPIPPSQLCDVDPQLEAICLRCLAKKPEARFESAAALAKALVHYLGGVPITNRVGARLIGAWAAGLLVVGVVAAVAAITLAPRTGAIEAKRVEEPQPQPGEADSAVRLREAIALYERGELVAAMAQLETLLEAQSAAADVADGAAAGVAAGVVAKAHSTRGAILLKQGRADEAEAALSRALSLDPRHAQAWVRRAAARVKLGRLEEAQADLEEAVRRSPTDPLALYNRGLMHLRYGRLRPAVADATRSLEQKPDQADALVVRGAALCRLKDYPSALRDLDRALELEPGVAGALFQRTRVRRALGDPVGAAVDLYAAKRALTADDSAQLRRSVKAQIAVLLKRVVALSPKMSTLFRESVAALSAKDLQRAVAGFSEILAANPVHLHSFTNRGLALVALGRAREGLKDLRAAVALNPEWSNSHYNLGVVLTELGKSEEAIPAYRRATELDPRNLEAWVNLGVGYFALRKFDLAERFLTKALSLDSKQVQARFARGQIRLSRGRFEAAAADFEVVVKHSPPSSSRAAEARKLLLQSKRKAQRR